MSDEGSPAQLARRLQVLYIVLISIALAILAGAHHGLPVYGHVAWVLALAGAIAARFARRSLAGRTA